VHAVRFKTIKQDGKSIKFQIWDTAGQERFRTITSAYYKGADGIVMVYDLTETSSVDDLENYWISEAYNYCDKSIKVLLLGNKCDAERTVNPEVTHFEFSVSKRSRRSTTTQLRT
jgi:Ras-related protein Rab-1A